MAGTPYGDGMGSVSVTSSGVVPASSTAVAEALRDLPAQSDWFPGCVSAEVLAVDDEGLPARARQVNDVKVAKDEFELVYEHTAQSMSWTLVAPSTAQKSASGSWTWREVSGGTEVALVLTIEPAVPSPGFMAKKVLGDTAKNAVAGLRQYLQ